MRNTKTTTILLSALLAILTPFRPDNVRRNSQQAAVTIPFAICGVWSSQFHDRPDDGQDVRENYGRSSKVVPRTRDRVTGGKSCRSLRLISSSL